VARLSRLIVLVSILAAGVAHAVLVSHALPALPWASGVAFAVSFALTRLSLPLALMPALLLAYTAPAVMMVGFGATRGTHDILVWLALFAGAVVAASDWTRWHMPPAWTPWVVAWALVIAVTWPIVAGREIDFSLVAARTLDTPNGIGAGPPRLAAAAITLTACGQLLGVLWLDLLWARFGSERVARAERSVFVPLIVSIVIASAAGLYQRYVDLEWLGSPEWSELQRASSLMLDANSFGMAAAIWAPLALVLARRLGRGPWIGAAVSALLLAGFWTSGSRTALLTAAAGFVAVFVTVVQGARTRRFRIGAMAVLVVAAAIVLAVALRSADRTNPVARLFETLQPDQTVSVTSLARALWIRDGYGTASMRAISEHPWTGVGIGAFNQLATDYSYVATGALIPPDNAQNWWRHQIAELGVLGAAPGIVFSLLIALVLWRGTASGERRHAAMVIRWVLVGIGIISLFGVATQHPALWLTFVTLLYWIGALVDRSAVMAAPAWSGRAVWAGVFILPILVATGQTVSAIGDLRVPTRAARIGFPYAYGFSAPDPDGVPWAGRHAVAVLRAEHAYFALTATPPVLDRPVRVRLWRGEELIADVEASGGEPVVRIIGVPAGKAFLMVESEVSALSPDGRGMKMVGRWLREIPADARPATVVP
jgi:O-antigen ligase